jgi:hypothetical protein
VENCLGGANTVTVPTPVTGLTWPFTIMEFSGVAKFNAFDQSGTSNNFNQPPTATPSVTTTGNSELVIAAQAAFSASFFPTFSSVGSFTADQAMQGWAQQYKLSQVTTPGMTCTIAAPNGIYTATIGQNFAVSGFTNSGNNGNFVVSGFAAPTSISFTNGSAVNETHTGFARANWGHTEQVAYKLNATAATYSASSWTNSGAKDFGVIACFFAEGTQGLQIPRPCPIQMSYQQSLSSTVIKATQPGNLIVIDTTGATGAPVIVPAGGTGTWSNLSGAYAAVAWNYTAFGGQITSTFSGASPSSAAVYEFAHVGSQCVQPFFNSMYATAGYNLAGSINYAPQIPLMTSITAGGFTAADEWGISTIGGSGSKIFTSNMSLPILTQYPSTPSPSNYGVQSSSITSNVLSMTLYNTTPFAVGSPPSIIPTAPAAGIGILITGSGEAYLNNQVVIVAGSPASTSTSFSAPFTHANFSNPSETATVTPTPYPGDLMFGVIGVVSGGFSPTVAGFTAHGLPWVVYATPPPSVIAGNVANIVITTPRAGWYTGSATVTITSLGGMIDAGPDPIYPVVIGACGTGLLSIATDPTTTLAGTYTITMSATDGCTTITFSTTLTVVNDGQFGDRWFW